MKKLLCILAALALLTGCAAQPAQTTGPAGGFAEKWADSGHTLIALEGDRITVTGGAEGAVTTANDIVYYEAGHDESYGEGRKSDGHSPDEAARHIVVHINAPGTYVLSGTLTAGQIAVDLGEDAESDPNAVVTLILDGVDVTCTVAPGVIFYSVYECGDKNSPSADVDTAAAGANVILADGSVNTVRGSHVAKIYEPGTEEKLHKYDAAFYSKMSMNIGGTDGILNIEADNEGLDSELHLTVNGGDIRIQSGNDGVNTNEDGVSVTTVNGGSLDITVTGTTGEGDGIDSNGWLVINGGTVRASACATSSDAGIDADLGVQINGGTVLASGNMLDPIDEGSQTHLVFSFTDRQAAGVYTLKDEAGNTVLEYAPGNDFQILILSGPGLTPGTYTLWSGKTQFQGAVSGRFGGLRPIERPEWPVDDGEIQIPPQPTQPIVTQGIIQPPPAGEAPAEMPVPSMPGGTENMPVPGMPEGGENMPMPNMPEGVRPPEDAGGRPIQGFVVGTLSTDFPVTQGANHYQNVQPIE